MCIACECAGDECNKRDRSSGLDRGRCSIGFARHGSHPKSLFNSFCIPSASRIGLAYFSPPKDEAVHTYAKFLKRGRRKKRNGNERWNQFCEARNMAETDCLEDFTGFGVPRYPPTLPLPFASSLLPEAPFITYGMHALPHRIVKLHEA